MKYHEWYPVSEFPRVISSRYGRVTSVGSRSTRVYKADPHGRPSKEFRLLNDAKQHVLDTGVCEGSR